MCFLGIQLESRYIEKSLSWPLCLCISDQTRLSSFLPLVFFFRDVKVHILLYFDVDNVDYVENVYNAEIG